MPEERKGAKLDMRSRSMPSPPHGNPRSHDAAASSVQDHHYSLPPRAKPIAHDTSMSAVQNHRCSSSLPPLPKSRPQDAAHSSVQDRRFRSAMGHATRIGKRPATASASPEIDSYRTTNGWKGYTPPPPPRPTFRWGHPESVLVVVLVTVFLLFLPLALPQLSPPPVALLLIPLTIMAASLLVLAFLPSHSAAAASS